MKVLIVFTFVLISTAASPFNFEENEVVPSGRISKGQKADSGQLPYVVGLSIKRSNSKYYICGGALINNQWILTAAHCIRDVVKVEIYLDSIYYWKPKKTIIVAAEDTFAHKDYNLKKNLHDIALIKIPAVNLTSSINTIDLPTEEYANYTGRIAVVAGWGRTFSSSGPSSVLQWANQTIISYKSCFPHYGSHLPKYTICIASTGGVSVCRGDSGGPLVLASENIVIGVAAMSLCDKPHPGIFTSVAEHLPWIKQIMYNN